MLSDKSLIGPAFTPQMKEALYPIVVNRAEGAHLWDIDGNRYVDILMGLGTNLFGHNPPFIRAAIEEQLEKGFAIGPQAELAGETAALFCQLTGKERVTFSNTGTEAVMTALRVARAATGRRRIAVFSGAYHGHSDQVLNKSRRIEFIRRGALARDHPAILKALQPILRRFQLTQPVPAFPGVSPSTAGDVLMLEYGNPRSLDILRRKAGSLAGILVEPVQSRMLELQPAAFLRDLRDIANHADLPLIFDEMISGFRVAPGGAQEAFGIEADLAVYGKIAGGGLPLSLIAGSNRYMDCIDGGSWSYGDASAPSTPTTFFAGTYCRHPLALAAARAAAHHLLDEGPGLQSSLNARTQALVQRLDRSAAERGLPIGFTCFGSFFHIATSRSALPQHSLQLLSLLLLTRGVHLRVGDKGGFLSTAHSETQITEIHDAFVESLETLADCGLIERKSGANAK
ncbi:aminotransferase class III-fold pyridoxal phosphate-dependent enzyme [Fulvimarina sp. MAC8]